MQGRKKHLTLDAAENQGMASNSKNSAQLKKGYSDERVSDSLTKLPNIRNSKNDFNIMSRQQLGETGE